MMSDTSDHSQIVLRRMMDANSNRVMEGLRTLEDVARFSDHARLQAGYKTIRHGLQETIGRIGQASLILARDAQGDVGRENKTTSEQLRDSGLGSIVAAAGSRVEQGLRVLEETAKVLAPDESLRIERFRYQVYDLNASLQLACQRDLEFLRRAKLYVLVDCKLEVDFFAQRLREISDAGVDLIQIRDKQADPIRVIQYARQALDLLDKSRTQVVINDRVDIAATMGVSGVHVGQEDLSVGAARRLLQPWQILGLSTHDLGQVQASIGLGVDYIGCGPTFASKTKSFGEFSGTAFLQAAAEWLRANAPGVPAYAIGGIDPENLPRVMQAGFDRIAVSSCVWNAQNPAIVVEKLRSGLDRI